MKKCELIISVLVVMVGMLGFAPAALALSVLKDDGQKVVHDDVNNLYWYWDVQHWANQTYQEQMYSVANELGPGYFQGTTGWHLATEGEFNVWQGYSATELYDAFGLQYQHHKTQGRFDVAGVAIDAHQHGYVRRNPWLGLIMEVYPVPDWVQDPCLGAWVVADAPGSTVIPEPGTLLLLGSGVLGLLALCRKYHNQP